MDKSNSIVAKRLLSKRHLDADTECKYRLVKDTTERFVLHSHDYYEIFLMVSGNAIHYINGETESINDGHLIFIRKDDIHDYAGIGGRGFEFANLAFSENTLRKLFDYLGDGFPGEKLLSSPMPPKVKLTEKETKRLHLKLAELNTVNFSDRAKLKSKARTFLMEIFTDYFENIREADTGIPFWLENAYQKMREPKNFIMGKDRFFSLCGKTREHATRCLKKYYGTTPSEYINELRLSYAANLLASSNLNATDVCYECGFQNISWFYSEFSRKYGTTPASCKKLSKNF